MLPRVSKQMVILSMYIEDRDNCITLDPSLTFISFRYGKSLSGFKMTLDQTLETIPDCPPSQGLYPAPVNYITGRNSNCLLDWSRYLRLSGRCTLLGDDSEIVYSV